MHQVLPRLQKNDNVESFSNRTADTPADITVLIASLQGRYYEELKDLYADQPNEANAMIRFYQVSHLVRIMRKIFLSILPQFNVTPAQNMLPHLISTRVGVGTCWWTSGLSFSFPSKTVTRTWCVGYAICNSCICFHEMLHLPRSDGSLSLLFAVMVQDSWEAVSKSTLYIIVLYLRWKQHLSLF